MHRVWVLGVAMLAAPRTVAAAPTGVDGFVTYSPYAAFDLPADGHGPTEKGIAEAGVGVDVYWRTSPRLELCVGARYDIGFGDEDDGHFVAAPVAARLALSLGGGHELRLGLGAGLAAGFVGDLVVLGPTGEVAIGYQHRARPDLGIFASAGVRVDMLDVKQSDDAFFSDGTLLNGQFPFLRAGVSWL